MVGRLRAGTDFLDNTPYNVSKRQPASEQKWLFADNI